MAVKLIKCDKCHDWYSVFKHQCPNCKGKKMAAEDYIDPWEAPIFKVRRERKRYHFWTTGNGESIRLDKMENNHLKNTLNYITHRTQEWENVRSLAMERHDIDIGEYIINNKLGSLWFDLMVTEIKRRQG